MRLLGHLGVDGRILEDILDETGCEYVWWVLVNTVETYELHKR
jgi:hypothetical protein